MRPPLPLPRTATAGSLRGCSSATVCRATSSSACRTAGSAVETRAATPLGAPGASGSLTRNKAPPSAPSPTSMRPPWRSTSSLAMVSPRPVPPKRRVVLSSPLRNRSKIASRNARGTPGPLSSTERTTSSPSTHNPARTCPPSGTNFIAFESRLSKTRSSFSGSASRATSSDVSTESSTSRSLATTSKSETVRRTSSTRSTRDRSSSIPPVSSFATSRRSLTCLSSTCALRSIVPRSRRVSSSHSPEVKSRRVGPRMSASGVRSSWLTLARNTDFVRLAASASSFARGRSSISPRFSKRSLSERTRRARISDASTIVAAQKVSSRRPVATLERDPPASSAPIMGKNVAVR